MQFQEVAGGLEEFDERIGDLGSGIVSDPCGVPLDILHQPIQIISRVGNAHHANRSAVPEAARIQLRDGDIEMGAQPVFQAPDDLPLLLEGLRGFDMELKSEKGNHVVLILSRRTLYRFQSDIHFRLFFLYKTRREFGVAFSNPQSEVIALRRSLP